MRSSTRITHNNEQNAREDLRRSFRPAKVRVLFVGESPPAGGTFFYAGDSELYRSTRDAFYEALPQLRSEESFLLAFSGLGCYLEDLCREPVNRFTAEQRTRARRDAETAFAQRLAALKPAIIVVLLKAIAPNVERAAVRARCRNVELHVVTYPSRWHSHRVAYRRELGVLLRNFIRRGVLRAHGYSGHMKLQSSSFQDGATIPQKYAFNGMGCAGDNVSPHLAWSDVPDGTKSFALVMHDPDAPTSGGFYHWVMFNIPGDTRELQEGSMLQGVVLGHTDYGQSSYGGPCPPPGAPHHYNTTLFALDVDTLPLDKTTTGAKLEFVASEHTLAKATLTGLYGRL